MYVCSSCGYETLGWSGKCPQCDSWGTLREREPDKELSLRASSGAKRASPARLHPLRTLRKSLAGGRFSLGINELDRVVGGGVVPGGVLLIAGEPGIGKSTLLLQVALGMEKSILYVSGEESLTQLYSRIERLSGEGREVGRGKKTVLGAKESAENSSSSRQSKARTSSSLSVTDESDVDRVISAIVEHKPSMVIVDSIQAVSTSDVPSYPGSIAQVRECGIRLTQCAKKYDIPMLIVGQVTKEGVIAGPKVLEHVVDAVLSFEGDETGAYRLVRCLKNRFGSTDEVGVFEMTATGLHEVADPSTVFMSRQHDIPGTALSAVYRGSRVLFVEIQALTSPSIPGAARRIGNGVSKQRVETLCAVLSRRAGIDVSGDDVYVSVLGGIRIDDPAIDAAICVAIASAKRDSAVKAQEVWVGEVGLTGEVRVVPQVDRIRKAAENAKLEIKYSTQEKALRVADAVGAFRRSHSRQS